MTDEIVLNLIQECQQELEKIAKIEQQLQMELSKLKKRPAEKKPPHPAGSQKRGQKSSKRRK